MARTNRRILLGLLLTAAAILVMGLQWDHVAAAGQGAAKVLKKSGKFRVIDAPKRVLPWDDGAAGGRAASPRAMCTVGTNVKLQFDSLGLTTVGVGPSSGVQAMQHLVHFGGAPATTQLCIGQPPSFQPVALSWSIFTCTQLPNCPPRIPRNNRMNVQNVHLWNATFTNGRYEPNNLVFSTVFRSAANVPATTVNTFVCKSFANAPIFNAANGHLFAGVGASGQNTLPGRVWALAGEPINPDNHREWVGSPGTMAVTMGPTTFSTQFQAIDLGIRLIVDGTCIPVELERFDASAGK